MAKSENTQGSTGFERAYNLDCSKFIEKKNNAGVQLSYLSWAYAWAHFKTIYPDATYEVVKNGQGLPYFADPVMGIMVYTRVTAGGETHEMWLPVMDGANKAMKLVPYTYKVKNRSGGFEDKPVKAADMFDVNKALMRCLTKNLAMFGLGLSIYAGEDIPQPLTADEEEAIMQEVKPTKKQARKQEEAKAELTRITMAMYEKGNCKNIIRKLVETYDSAAANLNPHEVERAERSFAWDAGVFDRVCDDAIKEAFKNDINA